MSPPFRVAGLVLVLTLAAVAVRAGTETAPPASAPEEVLARFPLGKEGHILLPVTLGSRTYSFVLDTGCAVSTYDTSLEPFLGEPLRTQPLSVPAGGVTLLRTFAAPEARLGRLSLSGGGDVVTADLSRFREASHMEIFGFLGMDFLARHVVRIDPDRGEVVFLRSHGPNSGVYVPIRFDEYHIPWVAVRIPGLEEPDYFQADTGAVGGTTGDVSPDLFDTLLSRGTMNVLDRRMVLDMQGTTVSRTGSLAEIAVGPCRTRDVVLGTSAWNILGLRYWSSHVVTFDFPGGAIYLKPRSDLQRQEGTGSSLALNGVQGRQTLYWFPAPPAVPSPPTSAGRDVRR
jgi:hypothetical protein